MLEKAISFAIKIKAVLDKTYLLVCVILAVISLIATLSYKKVKVELVKVQTENQTMREAIDKPAKIEKQIVYVPKITTIEKVIITTETVTIDRITTQEPTDMPGTILLTSSKPELPQGKTTKEKNYFGILGYNENVYAGAGMDIYKSVGLGITINTEKRLGVFGSVKW